MEEWTKEMLENYIIQHSDDSDQYWVDEAKALLEKYE